MYGYEPAGGSSGAPVYIWATGGGGAVTPNTPQLASAKKMAEMGFVAAVIASEGGTLTCEQLTRDEGHVRLRGRGGPDQH